MTDLNALTHEHFQRCLNAEFRLVLDGGSELGLTLVEVRTHGGFDPSVHQRQAFSVCFSGPPEPALAQRTYPLVNTTLGEFALFLVPVERTPQAMRYEAVFT